MATAQQVLAQREGGQQNPDKDTVRLVTLEIDTTPPIRVVKNTFDDTFTAGGKTYIAFYFDEKAPDIKPNVKPEMTISFLQVSLEMEKEILNAASQFPPPTVTRSTWEVASTGALSRTSQLLYPMPVSRSHKEEATGIIEVICADVDLDNVKLNPVVYNTDDHPRLKAYL